MEIRKEIFSVVFEQYKGRKRDGGKGRLMTKREKGTCEGSSILVYKI